MNDEKQVWFCFLPERAIYDVSFGVAQRIAYRAGARGYHPIWASYGRTDIVRQGCAEMFLRFAKQPNDTLVLFDIDHDHAVETIEILVAHDKPIVVPLMFRRGEPFEACAFRVDDAGGEHNLAEFGRGLQQVDRVGHGAIAIQRHVFDTLRAAGHHWFWKYEYVDPVDGEGARAPSEDLYFTKICQAAGIEMYVDTDFEAPHMTIGYIDQDVHKAYMADHPDILGLKVPAGQFIIERGDDEKWKNLVNAIKRTL